MNIFELNNDSISISIPYNQNNSVYHEFFVSTEKEAPDTVYNFLTVFAMFFSLMGFSGFVYCLCNSFQSDYIPIADNAIDIEMGGGAPETTAVISGYVWTLR